MGSRDFFFNVMDTFQVENIRLGQQSWRPVLSGAINGRKNDHHHYKTASSIQ